MNNDDLKSLLEAKDEDELRTRTRTRTQAIVRSLGFDYSGPGRLPPREQRLRPRHRGALLQEVTRRLAEPLPEGGSLLPLEGDAFMAILPLERASAAVALMLDAVRPPIAVDSHRFELTASLGWRVSTRIPAPPSRCCGARRSRCTGRRNRAATARCASNLHSCAPPRIRRRWRRSCALQEGQLLLHYQPIIDADGEVRGLEALLRWDSPRLGRVAPDRFVPVAERLGISRDLDRCVLQAACRQLAAWRRRGIDGIYVAVNVALNRHPTPSDWPRPHAERPRRPCCRAEPI